MNLILGGRVEDGEDCECERHLQCPWSRLLAQMKVDMECRPKEIERNKREIRGDLEMIASCSCVVNSDNRWEMGKCAGWDNGCWEQILGCVTCNPTEM